MRNKQETREQRFRRIASHRTNRVLERLRVLGHCANRQNYSYSEEQVNKIFSAIEKQVREIRATFHFPKENRFKL